jgi:hypothetical protein
MLKITKSNEHIEVKNIVACVYSPPGIGKTTLGGTADKPLLLDFDAGSYRAGNRGDVVQVDSWADVANVNRADLASYKTLVVDTAGRALDVLSSAIIQQNPKQGRNGALTLQGYGELKSTFVSWTKMVRGFGLDVVLLCHSSEERNGDETVQRLDVQGGSKGEIYKASDLMGRIMLVNGQRILNFNPSDVAFGKNPAQLPVLEVPDYKLDGNFLGKVIKQTKDFLNTLSVEAVKAKSDLEEWSDKVNKADSCGAFDALVAECVAKGLADVYKVVLIQAAKARGFAFNTDTRAFDLAPKDAA